MIERYNLRIGNDLIDWIEHLIPREDFKSSETTFHIDDVVNSEIIEAITIILQKFGHTDINKRISASTSSVLALNYIQSQNIIDNIFFESNTNQFTPDWVITIPKIKGGSAVALQFMKASMRRSKKGLITMIDSKPLLDKLPKSGDANIKEFLKFHMKYAVLIKPSIFGRDSMQTPLAFVTIKSFNTEIHFLDLKDSLHGNNKFMVYDSVKRKVDTYNSINDINIVFGNDDINAIVPAVTPGQPELYAIRYDNVNNRREVRRNGVTVALGASDGAPSNMTGQSIGRYLSTYGQFDLGEIIIYNRAVSDYEMGQVERDLISKWTIV